MSMRLKVCVSGTVCIGRFPFRQKVTMILYLQSAALVAVANVYETLDETSIRKMVLPKLKLVFEKNQSDLKIMANVLNCIERTLDKLDKSQVRKMVRLLNSSAFGTTGYEWLRREEAYKIRS